MWFYKASGIFAICAAPLVWTLGHVQVEPVYAWMWFIGSSGVLTCMVFGLFR